MRRRRLALLPAVLLLAAACGGDAEPANRAEAASASATVLTDAMHHGTAGTPVKTGDAVRVGEQVSTDTTGFGQLDYPDGSVTRLGPKTTYTVTVLATEATKRVIEGTLDVGETWHRVKAATGSGSRYDVRTPLGVATARGTTFSVTCTDRSHCEVVVVEGVVDFRATDGTLTTVSAGQRSSVTPAGAAPVVAAEPDLPWTRANTALDRGESPPPLANSDGEPCPDRQFVEQGFGGVSDVTVYGGISCDYPIVWFQSVGGDRITDDFLGPGQLRCRRENGSPDDGTWLCSTLAGGSPAMRFHLTR